MDLFSPTWQAICYLVNLAMSPIGPVDNTKTRFYFSITVTVFDKGITIR